MEIRPNTLPIIRSIPTSTTFIGTGLEATSFSLSKDSFAALQKKLNGFVYHLANDQNLSRVQLAANFRIKNNTALALSFDLKKLLNQPRALSFGKDGNSTHSHPGDAISSALVANLKSAFSVRGISYPPGEVPLAAVTPLFPPKKLHSLSLEDESPFPHASSSSRQSSPHSTGRSW